MADFDKNAWYRFTDKDGNTFDSRGDNGYVQQAMQDGIPISVDKNGNWYTTPYLDVTPDGYVAHIPNWFKNTDEYAKWQTFSSQIPNLSVNKDVFTELKDILKTLGNQGALRTSLTNDIKSYGVTDQKLIDKYVKDIVSMAAEGQGGNKAKLSLFGEEFNSAADFARKYKEFSKEKLSSAMTAMYDIMESGRNGSWGRGQNETEEQLAWAITAAKILNYVDDNHISFGKDDEFNGLLSSSVWQQINRGLTNFMSGITSNTFVGLPARLSYGTLKVLNGEEWSTKIEDLYNDRLSRGADLGAGLEGNDVADYVGMWGGSIGSIAITMATSMMLGSTINGAVAASSPGGFWAQVGNYAQTIPGSMVTDFFLNDIPLDLMIFTTDVTRYGLERAWFDPSEPQPLFGLPWAKKGEDGRWYPTGVGPDVPGGLLMNMVGDAILDAALPVLGIMGNATYRGLDELSNGGITRVREAGGLINLRVQEALANTPILGTGWQKFVNYMMGPENAKFVQEARKAAIAEGSMEPYVRAQNLLTLANHSGLDVLAPMYMKLDNELGLAKDIKKFIKEANKYGGIGETRVEWKDIEGGVRKKLYKVVPDELPTKVKQGLLDVERLSELRGEIKNEGGGLIPNPARDKEIAEIEERLSKTPQEIKDFANKFSEMNKRVEQLGVELGVTNQEWLDALLLDPRWESYMTRQSLVPGAGVTKNSTPTEAAILTKKRKGYYADNYIDPSLALGMKVEALGRAYAWNERAKAMVAFEISQGKVVAGKGGVETAKRLAEVKEQIKTSVEYRKSIGYDETVHKVNVDVDTINNAFRKINDLLNLPERITIKSVYDANKNPRIKSLISDFNNGKIQFADGVKEAAGLSDSDAAAIIQNTYARKGDIGKVATEKQASSVLFDDAMSLDYYKVGSLATYESRVDEIIKDIIDNKKSPLEVRNAGGEVDYGIYGLTPYARGQYERGLMAEQTAKNKAIDTEMKKIRKEIDKLQKQAPKWVEAQAKYIQENWGKDGKSLGQAQKEYEQKFPHPNERVNELLKREEELYGQKDYSPISTDVLTFNVDTRQLVDSDAIMPFNELYIKKGTAKPGTDYFQNLTRGEVRRALYEKGYDNLSPEMKAEVDKADAAFTQRTTEYMVLHRSETSGTERVIKIGEPLDTSSWMYTALTPRYTDAYREGLTGGKIGEGGGYTYRYHVKPGTPIYVPTGKPKATDSNGRLSNALNKTDYEFVFPRNIETKVIGISNERLTNTPWGDRVTVVDVEVGPGSGVTPKLPPLIGEKLASATSANIADNVPLASKTRIEKTAKEIPYNAGIAPDGTPYKYTLEDGKITSFEKIEDAEGYSQSVALLGGLNTMSADTVDKIGIENAKAVNRGILFYRDNMPPLPVGATYKMAPGDDGTLGWMYSFGANTYNVKLENNQVVAENFDVFLAEDYFAKGRDSFLQRTQQNMVDGGWSPKNSNRRENTAIHETGHMTMSRLAYLEINRKLKEGILTLPADISQYELQRHCLAQWRETHKLLAKNAIESLGLEFNDIEWRRQALTISGYAGSYGMTGEVYKYETFSEAMVDYWANGANASKFSLAIVDQMKKMSERFSVAASPKEVFAKNNLPDSKGMFNKDGEYNFPKGTKTDAAKAKWLDEWRQKNPYLKGKGIFSETDYQMANLWDTFFQKEIRGYDPKSKSSMPETLAKKNGDFLEDLSSNAAKKMVSEIKKNAVEGFETDLATMILSRNSKDVSEALDTFIIGRVNKAADELAAKLPGGATEENLNTARLTLWSEDSIRNDMIRMVSTLSPNIDLGNVQSKISELFDTQAKGFAAFDVLPIDTKKLFGEQKELGKKLAAENNYARKKGKEVDDKLEGYIKDVTQVIHYKESGEDVYVVVSDPIIAEVLKKPNNYKESGIAVEALAGASNFISRAYRLGTTGVNPLAFVRNVLRDPLQATIQGGFNPLNMSLSPDVFYHTLRNFGLDDATIKNVSERLATWSGSSGLTAEMRNMGMQTPGSVGYRNQVERLSKGFRNSKGKLKKVIEAGEVPLETWETMFRNQVAQQSFVKNYERYKDVNRAMGMAMFDASNSTTNFSHSVGLFKRATSTVPYLSSAINGTRSFWVQFNVDPIGMMTRIAAGFMVPAMAITAWNLSSEDRRDSYMNLPEWFRDSHIVLVDLEGNVVAFPIPEELSHYYGFTRRLMEYSHEATPYSIAQIMAAGAFGFLPMDVDGYLGEDGTIDWGRGSAQLISGLLPQAATTIYEFVTERDLFTGQDLSDYNWFNKTVNTLSNMLGTGIKNVVNDIGMMLGFSSKELVGKGTAETLARDLFGIGFDNATLQFMSLVGKPAEIDAEGKETQATGLFAENEKLQKQIEGINRDIAYAEEGEKAELEKKRDELISNFTKRVSNLTNKYMQLYAQTGGLQEWQKERIVKLLMLGGGTSSAGEGTYQEAEASAAYLNERSLAQQRYVEAGLPAGPSLEALADNGSIELQAAINRFYGTPKQAAQDYKNAIEETGLKDIRNEFYDAIQQIYDAADAQGAKPDYDLIEKIQARYLQAVDTVLAPLINQYGINILNNNDFIDAVRRQVNGMIPSDDWRQSVRNAKKFLSSKDFPTTTVDVKKWLKQRYSSGMRDRGLDSDAEVTKMLESIKADIDAGRKGAAKGKINSLRDGVNKANYYISSKDFQLLTDYNNMVK